MKTALTIETLIETIHAKRDTQKVFQCDNCHKQFVGDDGTQNHCLNCGSAKVNIVGDTRLMNYNNPHCDLPLTYVMWIEDGIPFPNIYRDYCWTGQPQGNKIPSV